MKHDLIEALNVGYDNIVFCDSKLIKASHYII